MKTLVLLALLLPLQDPVIETHPNGERALYSQVHRMPSGEVVRHGIYKRFAEDGTVLEAGKYKFGRRHGKWTFSHPNGRVRETGKYKNGVRISRWSAYREDGSVDGRLGGTYRSDAMSGPGWTAAGVELDDVRHGRWEWTWANGVPMLEGEFFLGEPTGDWFFRHATGDPDPEFLTGRYEPRSETWRGGRRGPARAEFPEFTGEPGSLGALPPLVTRGIDEAAVTAELERFLDGGAEAGGAAAILASYGPMALPAVAESLRATMDDAERTKRLLRDVIAPMTGHRSFGAPGGERLAALRWISYCLLLDCDPVTLAVELAPARAGESSLLEAWPPVELGGSVAREERIDEAWAGALEGALDWLARHQEPDGSWRAAGFQELCTATECDGEGDRLLDVGVTGLALVAMLGAPEELRRPHEARVARGLAWLLARQDPGTGCIGVVNGHLRFLYEHLIATQAVVDALALHPGGVRFRSRAQRAVDFIHRTRNPYKAWRYSYPPDGNNDMSVTGYAVSALWRAREVGLVVERPAFAGAKLFIKEMTDENTWRTGYLSKGGYSYREPGMNERWPETKTECMTAFAMFARLLLGEDPDESPPLRGGADLLRKRLPLWDEREGTIDFDYWAWGSHAMFGMGGQDWDKWQVQLADAVVKTQRQDGHARGSWDPQYGPFGHRGGRVYSTAMMALALEAPVRCGWTRGRR